MTKNAISTVEDVDELYWPRGYSNCGPERVFHVTRDCRYVDFTDKPIATTTVGNRPRGRLCKHCTPSDVTIDDLDAHHRQPDVPTDGGHKLNADVNALPEETHVSEKGLWIPPALRDHTGQIIFRTPRGTIQHWRKRPLEPYYGIIDASSFGPEESFRDCRNPELAPLQVSIKPAGEDAVVLDVTIDTDSGGGS